MACPKCNGERIVKSGIYRIKFSNIEKQRYKCKDCNISFIFRTSNYNKKISHIKVNDAINLYNQKKLYTNKYDPLQKETYSTREIAKILNVSPSYISRITKGLTKTYPTSIEDYINLIQGNAIIKEVKTYDNKTYKHSFISFSKRLLGKKVIVQLLPENLIND